MPIPPESNRLRIGRHGEANRIYHITLATREREPIFENWYIARPVISSLKQTQLENSASSLCWVIMPDHLHWLVELHVSDLSRVVARMKSRSTVELNRQLGRKGQLWQQGFHDRALRKADDLKAVARYIIANPLRAGLVTQVGDYPMWDAVWL